MKKLTIAALITFGLGGVTYTALAQEHDGPPPRGPNLEAVDTNQDGNITRDEMAAHRANRFMSADTDGDNLVFVRWMAIKAFAAPFHGCTVKKNFAFLAVFQKVRAAQKCRLTGTRRTDKAHHVALVGNKVHALENLKRAITLMKVANLDDRCGCVRHIYFLYSSVKRVGTIPNPMQSICIIGWPNCAASPNIFREGLDTEPIEAQANEYVRHRAAIVWVCLFPPFAPHSSAPAPQRTFWLVATDASRG